MNRPRQSVALHELRGPAVIRLEGRALSRPAWIFLAGLLLCASCSPPKAPPVVPSAYEVDALKGDVALREVKQFLDVGPRVAGTAGARNAAHYLKERLIALGVAAEVDEFRDATPEGSPGRSSWRPIMTPSPASSPLRGPMIPVPAWGCCWRWRRSLRRVPPHGHRQGSPFLTGKNAGSITGPTMDCTEAVIWRPTWSLPVKPGRSGRLSSWTWSATGI